MTYVCCYGHETHNLVSVGCNMRIPFFNLILILCHVMVCLLIVLDLGLCAFECLQIL